MRYAANALAAMHIASTNDVTQSGGNVCLTH